MIPLDPAPEPSRPTRRALFLKSFVDLLLFFLSGLVVFAGMMMFEGSSRRDLDLVHREDRWRFDAMPASDDELLAWARSQSGLHDFSAQRDKDDRQLVLRYSRIRTKGPAHPNWESLGYRMSYLVSAPSLETRRADQPLTFWLAVLTSSLAGGGGLAAFRISRARRAGIPLISPLDRPQRGWWRWFLVAFVGLIAVYGTFAWALYILNLKKPEQSILRDLPLSGWLMWLAVANIVLVAPIVEELLFRGCMFGRFHAYGYAVSGAIISAGLFSVVHVIPLLFPPIWGMGMVLAWLYHRTRSLWPSIALHSLNNGIVVAGVILSAKT